MLVWKTAGHQEVHLGAAMLPHMLAADSTAAQARSPGSYTNWGTEEHRRRQEARAHRMATWLPHQVYAAVWRRCTRRLCIQCLQAVQTTNRLSWYRSNVTEANHLSGGYSKRFSVKKTQKEQLLSYYHSCLKENIQILPAAAFNSASYGLNSLWS